jgi:hypothetical protein
MSTDQPTTGRRIFRPASPTEKIYIATGTIVVSRSSIAGALTREEFDTAVDHLEARYSIVRSVVEDGYFIERALDRSPVEAWLTSDMCSADALYAKLLNARLDAQITLYSIQVIVDDDRLDVFMLSSHAITDATSLVEVHSYLAHACDCVVRGVAPAPEEQPFPSPVDEAVVQSLALLPKDQLRDLPSYSGLFVEIPMRSHDEGGPVNHRLERVILQTDDVHRISAASHAHGSSVHSFLVTAFALAIRDVAKSRPHQILMRSTLDMRRRLQPHISRELVFSAVTGHITVIPDLDRPFCEIARLTFDDIHEGVADGRIFHDYVYYPKTFGSPQQVPIALNISDMQTVEFRWPTERLRVIGFEYALGWLKKFPNVSVSVYDGTLVATIVYVEEFADPVTMRAIAEGFVNRLASACGNS